MLRHALDDDLEEEPRVLHELPYDELVGIRREQHRLEVVRQLLVHALLLDTRYRLRDKHVLLNKTIVIRRIVK